MEVAPPTQAGKGTGMKTKASQTPPPVSGPTGKPSCFPTPPRTPAADTVIY